MDDIRDYLDLVRKQRRIEDQQRIDYLFSAINLHHEKVVNPSDGVLWARKLKMLKDTAKYRRERYVCGDVY